DNIANTDNTGVDRAISEIAPDEFDVTLTLYNITICGIAETLPIGLTFVSTTHPDEKVRVSGQNISFAVINETIVTYRVRSSTPGSGTPEITGIWIDLLSDSEGAVGGGAAPQFSEQPMTDTEAVQPNTPGFGAWVLVAMMFVAYLYIRR
ncbi:MAG: hypothetical protein U9N36_02990, partial [Euryarchaeota archaeon]|nr:hypothetical protein [Euryarchaeota archaeon]